MISGLLHSIESLLAWLDTFTGSPWFYLVVFGIALFDSVIPIVPSETTVILGGIAAGRGNLEIALVILTGACGAFLGDCTAYQIGRRAGGLLSRWFFRGERGAQRLERAGEAIAKRGGVLLITGRFIPGGRTAVTFACGLTGQPFWGWFARWDALATVVWASYAGLLGYLFGDRFKNDHATAFWLAFGTALGVTVLIEVIRHLRQRRAAARRPPVVEVEPEAERPEPGPDDGPGARSEQGPDGPQVGEGGAEERGAEVGDPA